MSQVPSGRVLRRFYVAGLGAVAIAVMLGLTSCGTGTEATSGKQATSVNPTELPPLDMYQSDITHEDYGRQLDVTLPYLREHRDQSMQEASDELDLQNRVNTLKDSELPTDPAMRKAQIDQNNITADLWTISKETNTTLARNLLNAVFQDNPDSTSDAYDLVVDQIGNGKGKFLEPTTVVEVSPVFTSGVVGGTNVDGQPTYLVQLVSRTADGRVYEQVVSERYSQSRESTSPVVVRSIQYGDPTYVEHPSQMTAGS